MAGKSKEQRLAAVHERALERYDRTYALQRDIREQCLQDRRFVFVPGAQYDGVLGDQFANRPRFEINKMHQSVLRTFSEYRNNRVTVDFRPADEAANDDTAEFLDGLYRADEVDSGGQEAYDTAFEEGVAGGMGAWRLMNCYEDDEDEEDERQRIHLVPIPDADQSVFFDADAKRYDKRDALCAFVITGLQDDAYGEETGEAEAAIPERAAYNLRRGDRKDITSFDKVSKIGVFDWFQPNVIYVAEYYEVELTKDTLSVYVSDASGEEERIKRSQYADKDEYAEAIKRLEDQGFRLARSKKIKRRRVHKYLIDGNRVIEDCGYIAGKFIPIIPYYGKRQIVDGVERVSGRVRLAIDAQRLYNMLASLLAEISVKSPVEKPILYPEEIAGHEQFWAEDDVNPHPYQLLNPILGPDGTTIQRVIQYTKPPAVPPALAGLIQLVGMDLKELLGADGDQQEVVSNISAKAVELIQNRLDMADFIFMDNLKQSMRWAGEVWLSMSRELYDENERPMRVVKPDGSDEVLRLREPTTGKDGASGYANDPSAGKFKVTADVGPSFTTRRDGTVRAITGMLQFVEDPNDKAVLTGVAIQNLEGEGLQDVKEYWRKKMLTMGVTKPTEKEAAELEAARQSQQPSAQDAFLMAEADKSRAAAAKMMQEIETLLSKAKEHEATAAEKLAKIEALDIETIMRMVDSLTQATQPAAQPGAQPQPEQQPA
ncbi:MAG TPA: portal protein [Ramlibacter sp.]|uniref:portal protein n=1 Tax=Ramlibacter sp. TaxID=1917967 RepID=UPI002ED27F92